MGAGLPIGPQRQEEITVGLQWNAAQDIGEGRTVEDSEQCAGQPEDSIEQRNPYAYIDMVAQCDADAAQEKQQENDHEREIEAAEGRGVEEREGEIERTSASEEPDFIAVPHGAD